MFERSEREVETEVEGGVRVKGYHLFAQRAERVIHSEKEVDTSGMQVYHPAESDTVCSGSDIDVGREHLDGRYVCRQTELSP